MINYYNKRIFLPLLAFVLLLVTIENVGASSLRTPLVISNDLANHDPETAAQRLRTPLNNLDQEPEESRTYSNLEDELNKEWERVVDADPPKLLVPSMDVMVVGKEMTTFNGRTIYAFQGFRYGEAPLGDMRYKPSKDPGPYWAGQAELMADHMGDKCPQKAMVGHIPAGSEDCLFLNVYIPELPTPGSALLPVMFFIHGGAFIAGDASMYLPTRLLEEDVILVVIHYRLGAMGWFSLQNDNAPGNAGLYDQLLALQWVQKHVEGFGGDKERVTIFGQSAGGTSVSLLQTLPAAQGLFAGVIGQSGSALEFWAIDANPIQSGIKAGGICGCTEEQQQDLQLLYECMRDLPHETLAMCNYEMVAEERANGHMGFEGCAPVVQAPGVTNPIITKMPIEYILDREANDVPLMMGATRNEGSFVLGLIYTSFLVPNNYHNNSDYLQTRMLDDFLACFGLNDQTHALEHSLQRQYLPGVDMTSFDELSPGMIDMAGMFFLKAGAWETCKQHSLLYTSETFFYSFDFTSNDTMFDLLFMNSVDIPFETGVTHADDLIYLFPMPSEMTPRQVTTKDRLVKLWTNFAIYGNPTPAADTSYASLDIPEWPPLTSDNLAYLLMQDSFSMEKNYPDRWTIAMDMSSATPEPTTPTTTTVTPTTTTTTTEPPENSDDSLSYDDLSKQRNSFMIAMIVFIVFFAGAAGFSGFLLYKGR